MFLLGQEAARGKLCKGFSFGLVVLWLAAAVPDALAQTQAVNTAVISPPTGIADPSGSCAITDAPSACTGNNTATDTDPIQQPANVAITKTGPASVLVGAAFQYTVTLTNNGEVVTGTPVVVQDLVPVGVVITSATGATCTGLPFTGNGTDLLTCQIATAIEVDGTATIVFEATAPETAGQIVNYVATNPAGTGDPGVPPGAGCVSDANTSCGSATTQVEPLTVILTKSAIDVTGPDAAGVYTVNYTITVTNALGRANRYGPLVDQPSFSPNVTIIDATWVSASGSGAPAGGSATGPGPYTLAPADTNIGASSSHVYSLAIRYRYDNTDPPTLCSTPIAPGNGLYNDANLPDGQDSTLADDEACIDPPLQLAELTIVKTTDRTGFLPEEEANYILTITNTGGQATTDTALVTDTIPAGLTIGTLPAGCVLNPAGSQTIECTIAAGLAVGGQEVFQIPVTPVVALGGTEVTNTATISGGADPTCPATTDRCSSTVVTPIGGRPELRLVKSAAVADTNGNTVLGDVGDTITYSFTVTNTGSLPLDEVVVVDPLLPGLSCVIDSLPIGATDTCTATGNTYVIQASDVPNGVENTATATGRPPGGFDRATDDDTVTTPTVAAPVASLELTKSASVADTNGNTVTGDAGDTVTYGFTVTNTGTVDLTDVTVTDPMLPGLSCTIASLPVGATESCTASGNTYVIQAGDVPDGVTNTATATGTPPGTIDPPTDTDTVITPTAETPTASITLTKTATVADTNGSTVTGDAGDTITYGFSVSNTGGVDLTNVEVTDPLLPGLSCTIASLPVGATESCSASGNTYVIQASDVPGGVTNTATATGTPPGTLVPPTDTDTVTTPTYATPEAALTLTKSATVADTNGSTVTGDAGDTITYGFSVTNTGSVDLTDVTVTDPLLPGLSCTIASLPASATESCTASGNTYVIQSGDVPGGVTNTATATGTPPGTLLPPTDTDTVTTPTYATPEASLTLTKSATVADTNGSTVTGDAGDTISYSFSVTNTGTVELVSVTVTDPLLSGLSCTIAPLPVGATESCTATGNTYVIQASDVPGGVTNTATATGTPPGTLDPATDTDTITTPTQATPTANIELTKTAVVQDTNGSTVTGDPGDTIVYSFSVRNTGEVALSNVIVSDPLLPSLSCVIPTLAVNEQASCAASGNTYVIQNGDVPGGVTNTATVTGQPPGSIDPPSDTDTVTTPTVALPVAALTLDKTATVADTNANGLTGDAGDTITYSFSVTNTGETELSNVAVADPMLPSLSCTIASLAVGATASCTAAGNTYVIQASDVPGNVVNTATATGQPPGTIVPPIASDTATTPTTAAAPALVLVKLAGTPEDLNDDGLTDHGDRIPYTFGVTNTGNTVLEQVQVDDPRLGAQPIGCTPSTLAPGENGACGPAYYIITEADEAVGDVENTATANAIPPGGTQVISPPATVHTPIDEPLPSITTAKAMTGYQDVDGNGAISVGDVLTYDVNVTNTGNSLLHNVVVSDQKITPSSTMCADLPAGGVCTLTGTYVVTQADADAGQIVNTALVTVEPPPNESLPPDVCPAGSPSTLCQPTVTVPLSQTPAIGVSKTATLTTDNETPGKGNVGDVITYQVAVTNTGNTTLTGVSVQDTLQDYASTTLNCAPTTLTPGQSAICEAYTHTVTEAEGIAGQPLRNTVVATGQSVGGSAVSVTATATATVDVEAIPATIRIVKTASPRDVKTGDLVRYTLTIQNTGAVNLVDGTIIDTPAAGFNYVTNSLEVGDDDNAGRLVGTSPIRVDQIDIVAGDSATVTYLLRVGAGVRPGTHINSVYVQSGGETVSNVAQAEVQMVSDPMLDESLIIGSIYDDRDGDGWQDSAELTGVRIQGGFAPEAYVPNSTTVDRGQGPQFEPDASAPLLHGIAIGTLVGRQSEAEPAMAHPVVISQLLRELTFAENFILSSDQGLSLQMNEQGRTQVARSRGDAARGLTSADPHVLRQISRVKEGYRVDYVLFNEGIDERGIPGVRVASVEGLVAETDQFGRYHLLGVDGGRWERGRNLVLKVDPATVPPGSEFTTDISQLRRITPGVPARFDFGIKLPSGLIVGEDSGLVELTLEEGLFASGGIELGASADPVLERIAEELRTNPQSEVILETTAEQATRAYDRARVLQAALLRKMTKEQMRGLRIGLRTRAADPDSTLLLLDSRPHLQTTLFEPGQATLAADYRPLLDRIAHDLGSDGHGEVIVESMRERQAERADDVLDLRRIATVYDTLAAGMEPARRDTLRVISGEPPPMPIPATTRDESTQEAQP